MTDRSVSRFLWIVPVILFGLMVHQAWVVYSVTQTWNDGKAATAEIVDYEMKEMAAQTHGIMTLRIPLPDGHSIEETLSMPAMLATQVRNTEQLEVRVRPGRSQQIVVAELMRTQRRMAMINVIIAGLGAVFVAGAIIAWRRYINRSSENQTLSTTAASV
jgi:hypothetical protein